MQVKVGTGGKVFLHFVCVHMHVPMFLWGTIYLVQTGSPLLGLFWLAGEPHGSSRLPPQR